MPVKKYKPTTPGRRGITSLSYEEVTTDKPEKSLLEPLKSRGGRNNNGRITIRHQGGEHKRAYRVIDFKRSRDNILARVTIIEYDPNRSANIALLNYADGEERYIIAPKGLTVGMGIISGESASIKVGNTMELRDIPGDTFIRNIKLRPSKGGRLARSAGVSVQILGVERKYTTVHLAPGEVRRILSNCHATIGQVSNGDHSLVSYDKAEHTRWKGVRPTVRGSVMNPNDHPHGDDEGRTPIGHKSPMTPWGKETMSMKTRKAKRVSAKLIARCHNGK